MVGDNRSGIDLVNVKKHKGLNYLLRTDDSRAVVLVEAGYLAFYLKNNKLNQASFDPDNATIINETEHPLFDKLEEGAQRSLSNVGFANSISIKTVLTNLNIEKCLILA